MDVAMKRRKPNYADVDVTRFLEMLDKQSELISYGPLYGEELATAWDEFAIDFNAGSLTPRTGTELRTKFSELKSKTKKRVRDIERNSTSAGQPPKELSANEKLTVSLAGESFMGGIRLNDEFDKSDPLCFPHSNICHEVKDENEDSISRRNSWASNDGAGPSSVEMSGSQSEEDLFSNVKLEHAIEAVNTDIRPIITRKPRKRRRAPPIASDVSQKLLVLTNKMYQETKRHNASIENFMSSMENIMLKFADKFPNNAN